MPIYRCHRNNELLKSLIITILSMFAVWDVNRDFLKLLMTQSASKDSDMSNYYFTSILILTDIRDQAGRIASNIIAPITFSEPISDENRARSFANATSSRISLVTGGYSST